MKTYEITMETSLAVDDLRSLIGSHLDKASFVDLESNSVSASDAAIAVLAEWKPLIGEKAAVQIYVHELGDRRVLNLVALGTSLGENVMLGVARDPFGVVPLRASKRKATAIANALRSADATALHG